MLCYIPLTTSPQPWGPALQSSTWELSPGGWGRSHLGLCLRPHSLAWVTRSLCLEGLCFLWAWMVAPRRVHSQPQNSQCDLTWERGQCSCDEVRGCELRSFWVPGGTLTPGTSDSGLGMAGRALWLPWMIHAAITAVLPSWGQTPQRCSGSWASLSALVPSSSRALARTPLDTGNSDSETWPQNHRHWLARCHPSPSLRHSAAGASWPWVCVAWVC